MAKTLSMDLRTNDPEVRLSSMLGRGGAFFDLPLRGENACSPDGDGDALARSADTESKLPTPVVDSMFSQGEPQTGYPAPGLVCGRVDNPTHGRVFTVTLKEVNLGSVAWSSPTYCRGDSGNYRAMDGLARLSLDMRVIGPAGWHGCVSCSTPLSRWATKRLCRACEPWPSTAATLRG
jgi:ribonucleoside-diphosphate reductase alpha chain